MIAISKNESIQNHRQRPKTTPILIQVVLEMVSFSLSKTHKAGLLAYYYRKRLCTVTVVTCAEPIYIFAYSTF